MKFEKTSIKKNFAYQMIYEILIIILPFITSPYIARVIGAEGLGIYSYSYSIAYYFVLFSMLGLKNYGNRAIAQSRDDEDELNKVFSNILSIHIIISFIFIVMYLCYIFILSKERIYAIIQLAYVVSAIFDISWFYFGIEKFKLTVMRSSVIKILNVLFVLTFVKKQSDLWIYCLIMAFGMLISQLTLWIPLKKYVKIVKPSWKEMYPHIKPMLILFIPTIAVSLYKYMDKIMIGSLSNKAQLGFYENAEKVNNMPITVIGSFGTVMLPKMSNLASKDDKKSAKKYIAISMQYVMWISLALSFGLAGVGEVFAPVFWGSKFTISGAIIKWLSITIPFNTFANVIRTQYLIPNHKDKEYMSSVVAGALSNLVINAMLIPHYGALGATIGTIVAEMLVCIIQIIVVRNELPIYEYIKSFFFFIVIGVIMFYAIRFLGIRMNVGTITLLVQIILGGIIYITLSIIYFLITKNEIFIKICKSLLSKLKK